MDFVPRLSFLPFDWRALGTAFGREGASGSGRVQFAVRQGFNPLDGSTIGRVVDGSAELGASYEHQSLVVSVSAGSLQFRGGRDDPAASVAQAVGEAGVPSLKLTAAKRLGSDDNYVAVTYDLKQRKPELSVCWHGDAARDRATLLLKADPIMRAVRISAAVSTPGPEWRKVLYDDVTNKVEVPKDDGGRHTLYLQHVAQGRDLLHRTRLGCRLDLGRIINYAVDYFDYHIEENLPTFFYKLPGSLTLLKLLVPPDDRDDQVRHDIKGWELDVSHEFGPGKKPRLELAKTLKAAGGVTLHSSYDLGSSTAGLGMSSAGVTVEARAMRVGGSLLKGGWSRPSLHFAVEPLVVLGL